MRIHQIHNDELNEIKAKENDDEKCAPDEKN